MFPFRWNNFPYDAVICVSLPCTSVAVPTKGQTIKGPTSLTHKRHWHGMTIISINLSSCLTSFYINSRKGCGIPQADFMLLAWPFIWGNGVCGLVLHIIRTVTTNGERAIRSIIPRGSHASVSHPTLRIGDINTSTGISDIGDGHIKCWEYRNIQYW